MNIVVTEEAFNNIKKKKDVYWTKRRRQRASKPKLKGKDLKKDHDLDLFPLPPLLLRLGTFRRPTLPQHHKKYVS